MVFQCRAKLTRHSTEATVCNNQLKRAMKDLNLHPRVSTLGVSVTAVREQLLLLGHTIPDDVIIDFLNDGLPGILSAHLTRIYTIPIRARNVLILCYIHSALGNLVVNSSQRGSTKDLQRGRNPIVFPQNDKCRPQHSTEGNTASKQVLRAHLTPHRTVHLRRMHVHSVVPR